MKTVYFICSLLMIGMISYLFREYPMLVGCICFGIGIGYMREKNKKQRNMTKEEIKKWIDRWSKLKPSPQRDMVIRIWSKLTQKKIKNPHQI